MYKAPESTAAIAKGKAVAALEAEANDSNRNLKEGKSAIGTTRENEAAATHGTAGSQGQLEKSRTKKVWIST